MDKNTSELRGKIAGCQTIEAQLAALKGAYAGRTCYVLSCGPSLRDYSPELLHEKLQGELVFTIKQAELYVPGLSDFHLLNTCNNQKYEYGSTPPIVVLERIPKRGLRVFGRRADVTVPIVEVSPHGDRQQQLRDRLVVSRDFEAWTFDRSIRRPWGPSIMYELGIYLAVHLGVSRIVVIGWDLDDPNKSAYTHFYEQRAERFAKLRKRAKELLPMRPFGFVGFARHHMGLVYNKCYVEHDETRLVIEASRDLCAWLKGRGVELALASTRSYLDASIPRVTL